MTRPLAVVTGASSGIGLELARCCIADGYDVVVCADEPEIAAAAAELGQGGAAVETVQADLATGEGTERLLGAIGDRPVDALLANAGIGLGNAFLDQDLGEAERVVALNVTGTLALVHAIGRRMRARGEGRILITGSIAGFLPGSFQAVYNGTKAFLDSFSMALRNELEGSGVTVTCLMPGPTDTEFFARAGMLDTPIGRSESKADPADVARQGYEAMKAGKSGIVTGFMNKVQTVFAGIIPDTVLAEMHRRTAEPDHR
jgi:short-subunit dehydrogenase